jgi:hypothetical protein
MLMRKHFSVDVKNVIARMRGMGKSIRAISHLTGVSKSTVHRTIQEHPICKCHIGKKRTYTLWNEAVLSVIRDTLEKNPFSTLKSIRQSIHDTLQVYPKSVSTISNWLRHFMKVSRKRISGKYVVNNDRISSLRGMFSSEMSNTSYKEYLSIDETSIYFSENSKYGYSLRGVPLKHRMQLNRTYVHKRVTLLMAVSSEKVIHVSAFPGSCNAQIFSNFIRDIPEDAPRNILMDNVAFHKTKQVKGVCDEKGFNRIFIPPYSPDYNPIENIFAVLKSYLRRIVDQTGHLELSIITSAPYEVSGTTLCNTFRHCWKLFQPI